MNNRLTLVILTACVLTGACNAKDQQVHEYQIAVNGSVIPELVEFTGSYTYLADGQEITRDLSGAGSISLSLQSTFLKRVRVQRVLSVGVVSLVVYQDGEVIFETIPTDSAVAIVFTNTRD